MPRILIDDSYGVRNATAFLTGSSANDEKLRACFVRTVDAGAWSYLMSESGMRTFMDANSRSRWDDQIRNGELPELNAANIEATFQRLHESRIDMMEEGVIDCFRKLSWHYKTNEPFKFGKKLIISHLHDDHYLSLHSTDSLDDLVRVFCFYDDVPQPDFRGGVRTVIQDAWRAGLTVAENDYFSIRTYKKGTGHLTFKRPDLTEKLNLIIAKHFPNALRCKT